MALQFFSQDVVIPPVVKQLGKCLKSDSFPIFVVTVVRPCVYIYIWYSASNIKKTPQMAQLLAAKGILTGFCTGKWIASGTYVLAEPKSLQPAKEENNPNMCAEKFWRPVNSSKMLRKLSAAKLQSQRRPRFQPMKIKRSSKSTNNGLHLPPKRIHFA